MRKNILVILVALGMLFPTAAFGQKVKVSRGERKIADTITAEKLSNWLHFVASDAMAGRDTPSNGLDATAEFLKMNLQAWGFKPAGDDGTFFQNIALRMEKTDPDNNFVELGDTKFALNEDMFRIIGNGKVSGDLVFGGNGWSIKSKGIDAFQGVDVKGKIVVIQGGGFPSRNSLTAMPQGIARADLTGPRGGDWADPLTNATQNGAVGVIVIANEQTQGAWQQLRNFIGQSRMVVEKLEQPSGLAAPLPVALVSRKAGDAIFAGEAGDKTSTSAFALKKSASVSAQTISERKWTKNVVALWEGTDPELKKEMVAVGAHYDHVGVNENAPGPDKIWNGADDDGSGTVAVLSIAEAFAKSKKRPKRSVLFVWHTAEEKGLLGAQYFNKFPTVDIKNVIAQLNIDMIGRSQDPNNIIKCTPQVRRCNEELAKGNEVYVIGSEMMSSELGAITKGTNDAFLKLDYNLKFDDPKDPNRFFFRSDHFHYAQNGIPIVFWFTGVHEDYHQAEDHADKIDYRKYEKISRTIFMTLWQLTKAKSRPKIDKTLPPELRR